jgi:hypothetical protein
MHAVPAPLQAGLYPFVGQQADHLPPPLFVPARRTQGAGSNARENDPYEALGVGPAASADDIEAAYFDRALPYHPDMNLPGDEVARAEFRRLSEAYWALSSPWRRSYWDDRGELSLAGFSLDDILREWLSRMLLGFDMEVGIIGKEIFHGEVDHRDDLFIAAHFEAPATLARKHHGQVSTVRRQRCRICHRRMKGREVMQSHLMAVHGIQIDAWEHDLKRRSLEGFSGFMQAALGLDLPGPGSRVKGAFAHPDGTRGCVKDCSRPFEWNHQQVLDTALASDPLEMDAIESANAYNAPQEVIDVVKALQTQQPECASFLGPAGAEDVDLEWLNPDIVRYSRRLTRHRTTARYSSSTSPRSSSRSRASRASMTNCSCGFTSGTAAALARHLEKFPNDPEHQAVM